MCCTFSIWLASSFVKTHAVNYQRLQSLVVDVFQVQRATVVKYLFRDRCYLTGLFVESNDETRQFLRAGQLLVSASTFDDRFLISVKFHLNTASNHFCDANNIVQHRSSTFFVFMNSYPTLSHFQGQFQKPLGHNKVSNVEIARTHK